MEKLIKLNESYWHYKLIKFVWAFEPKEFKNLCPYFWLTIASLFVLPFIIIWKGIKKFMDLIYYPFTKLVEWIDDKSYQKMVLRLSDEDLYFLKNRNHYSDNLIYQAYKFKMFRLLVKFADKYPQKIEELLSKFEDTLQIRESLAKKVINLQVANEKKKEKLRETLILEEQAKKKRKQRMNKIANATKSIFNFIIMLCIVIFIFAVSTGLTDLIIYLSSFSINWVEVMCYLVAFIIGVILVLIISLVIYLIEKWAKSEDNKWYYWTLLPIYYFLYYSGQGIVIVARFIWYNIIGGIIIGVKEGFKEFGGIFAEYFSSSYSDYCPGIEWEEEK